MRVLIEWLRARSLGPTIVYVTLQKTAEYVAAALLAAGFTAKAYHAGMEAEVREAVQNCFMASDRAIFVATIAFGMGIDKANIRAVYHYPPISYVTHQNFRLQKPHRFPYSRVHQKF